MLSRQLDGYRITTAKIIYHRPDYPSLLQEYVWQDMDIAPKFPVLTKFLDFWEKNLDGPIHSVQVEAAKVIMPSRFGYVDAHLAIQ